MLMLYCSLHQRKLVTGIIIIYGKHLLKPVVSNEWLMRFRCTHNHVVSQLLNLSVKFAVCLTWTVWTGFLAWLCMVDVVYLFFCLSICLSTFKHLPQYKENLSGNIWTQIDKKIKPFNLPLCLVTLTFDLVCLTILI